MCNSQHIFVVLYIDTIFFFFLQVCIYKLNQLRTFTSYLLLLSLAQAFHNLLLQLAMLLIDYEVLKSAKEWLKKKKKIHIISKKYTTEHTQVRSTWLQH